MNTLCRRPSAVAPEHFALDAEAGRAGTGAPLEPDKVAHVMHGLGTLEPYIMEEMTQLLGERAVSVHWRKPLRIDEVARLAPTEEVRLRPGRA